VIVIDASAFIDAVDGRPEVRERLSGEDLHAPHLLDVEVASALRRLVAGARFHLDAAERAIAILEESDIKRYPHHLLLRSAWSLRDTLSAYDAMYAALAATLDVPLVTTDRKLAAAHHLPCSVEVL
jgi:predicted nucleic acid-binding protein